jgi:hypothetical protein
MMKRKCKVLVEEKVKKFVKNKIMSKANPISSKTKANNCYLRPILDILFKKWFPLFEVPSPRTTTP